MSLPNTQVFPHHQTVMILGLLNNWYFYENTYCSCRATSESKLHFLYMLVLSFQELSALFYHLLNFWSISSDFLQHILWSIRYWSVLVSKRPIAGKLLFHSHTLWSWCFKGKGTRNSSRISGDRPSRRLQPCSSPRLTTMPTLPKVFTFMVPGAPTVLFTGFKLILCFSTLPHTSPPLYLVSLSL